MNMQGIQGEGFVFNGSELYENWVSRVSHCALRVYVELSLSGQFLNKPNISSIIRSSFSEYFMPRSICPVSHLVHVNPLIKTWILHEYLPSRWCSNLFLPSADFIMILPFRHSWSSFYVHLFIKSHHQILIYAWVLCVDVVTLSKTNMLGNKAQMRKSIW